MNRDELASVEATFGIDRRTLRRVLEEAVDDQRRMEELAEKHSCELPAWVDLAAKLDVRRAQSSTAVERIVAETMELDETVFGAVSRADCIEIVRALGAEVERALKIRTDAARLLISFARAYRPEGYQGSVSEVVDHALNQIVAQLAGANQVPAEVATKYVALLARECGVIAPGASDPALVLAERLASTTVRFPDLTSMLSSSVASNGWRNSGKSFEEIANEVQQTALGLWPAAKG
jgi:hypothetical protein